MAVIGDGDSNLGTILLNLRVELRHGFNRDSFYRLCGNLDGCAISGYSSLSFDGGVYSGCGFFNYSGRDLDDLVVVCDHSFCRFHGRFRRWHINYDSIFSYRLLFLGFRNFDDFSAFCNHRLSLWLRLFLCLDNFAVDDLEIHCWLVFHDFGDGAVSTDLLLSLRLTFNMLLVGFFVQSHVVRFPLSCLSVACSQLCAFRGSSFAGILYSDFDDLFVRQNHSLSRWAWLILDLVNKGSIFVNMSISGRLVDNGFDNLAIISDNLLGSTLSFLFLVDNFDNFSIICDLFLNRGLFIISHDFDYFIVSIDHFLGGRLVIDDFDDLVIDHDLLGLFVFRLQCTLDTVHKLFFDIIRCLSAVFFNFNDLTVRRNHRNSILNFTLSGSIKDAGLQGIVFDGYVIFLPLASLRVANSEGHVFGRHAFAGAFLWLRARFKLNPLSRLSIADGAIADTLWPVAADGLARRVNGSSLLPLLRVVVTDHESLMGRLQTTHFEILIVDGVEFLPLVRHMIAHSVLIAAGDCTAYIRVFLVVMPGIVFPDTSLNVANGILLGLWFLAAGPICGIIDPLELDPVAFEANRVSKLLRCDFRAAGGIVETTGWSFSHAVRKVFCGVS